MRYVILPSPAAPLKGAVPIPHPYRRSSDCPAVDAIVADDEAALFLVADDFQPPEPTALEADIFATYGGEGDSQAPARGILVGLLIGAVTWLAAVSVWSTARSSYGVRSPDRVAADGVRMFNPPGPSDPACPMTVEPRMITDPPTAPDDCR